MPPTVTGHCSFQISAQRVHSLAAFSPTDDQGRREELYGYRHANIDMVVTFSVHYGSRALSAFTYQVFCHGANPLGFDHFCTLGFSITENMGATILMVSMPWQQRWLPLAGWLGYPRSSNLCTDCSLLSFRNSWTLASLSASPWVSNVVVVRNTGGLCPCMDLRQVNGCNPRQIPAAYSGGAVLWLDCIFQA